MMKSALVHHVLPVLGLLAAGIVARPAESAEPQLAHVVVFTLKDHAREARETFVASCEKYLDGHEGTVSFSVGTIAEDVKEPVSDRAFDVVVHLVFRDKAAAESYQKSDRHQRFVAENKDSFAKVRVFDSYLAAAGKK